MENGHKQQRLVLWPVPYRYAVPSVNYQQHFPPLDKTLIDSNKEKKRKEKQAEEKPDLFTHRVSMSHRIDGHGMKHEYTLLSYLFDENKTGVNISVLFYFVFCFNFVLCFSFVFCFYFVFCFSLDIFADK